MRPALKKLKQLVYLSQQAVPSDGWAQQSPPLSVFETLGVQHVLESAGCAQHAAAASLVSTVFFSRDAIDCVSMLVLLMINLFTPLETDNRRNDA